MREPLPYCEHYPIESDDYMRCVAIYYTGTIFHPVGTCKMGPDGDPEAVVNPRLQVRNIKSKSVIKDTRNKSVSDLR